MDMGVVRDDLCLCLALGVDLLHRFEHVLLRFVVFEGIADGLRRISKSLDIEVVERAVDIQDLKDCEGLMFLG